MRLKLAVIVLVALGVVGLAPSLWAGWMSAYSGYSAFEDPINGNTDGYVSFAVWDRGANLGENPSLPQGAKYMGWVFDQQQNKYVFDEISLSGRYIYFYQVVNAQNGGSALKDFRIFDLGFIQVGFVDNAVFLDSQGPVPGSGNVALDDGTLGHPITGDDQVDGKPTLSGIPPAGLANPNNGNPVAPTSIDVNVNEGYTQWNFLSENQGILSQDYTSYLLFATSDLRPTYKESEERDGKTANCDVPATPEPGSLAALAGLAMTTAGLGIVRRRRSRG